MRMLLSFKKVIQLGFIMNQIYQFKALLLPAVICLLLAIAYKLMVRSQTKLGSDATLKS